MPEDRSILSSGRAEQARVTAEGWRGRLPSPPLERSGPQAGELRRDSASSARDRARRVCQRAREEPVFGVDPRCPETVLRRSTPTSTRGGTNTPGGRNGRLVVEDLGVCVGQLGAPPTRNPLVELERDARGRSSSRSLSSRSHCRPASGTVGGRQTRLAPDGSGGWPAEVERAAPAAPHRNSRGQSAEAELGVAPSRCRKRPGFLKGVGSWSE